MRRTRLVDRGACPDPFDVDESFLALPLSALTDAALTRAVDLGCEHADIRVERIRTQTISLRDARPEAVTDGEDLGLAVRVVHEGTWGFAAGVVLTAAEAVRLAEEAVAVAKVSAAHQHRPRGAGPRAGVRGRGLRVRLRGRPVRRAGRREDRRCSPSSPSGSWPPTASSTCSRGCMHVKEQKYYADTAGTRTRQQRVRIHPRVHRAHRRPGHRRVREHAHPGPAGRPRLGVPHRRQLGLGPPSWPRSPSCCARRPRRPSVEAGRYDLVIDPSNLWLTIHESIGHATELDRALGYEAAYAGTSFATVDKLGTLQYGSPLHARHRRPHRRRTGCPPSAGTTRASPGSSGTSCGTASWSGYQVDRNMARLRGLARSNGCAFADSPGHVPVQRMANVSLQPGARRPLDRGAHRRGRAGHLRRRRQELVDRHAALQLPVHRPAVLPDRGRAAGRPAARRRLPGDDDGLLGLDGGRRRAADLRPGRRVQLRQGPARAGRAGQPRLPDRALRPGVASSTRCRRPGDEPADRRRSWSSRPGGLDRRRAGHLRHRALRGQPAVGGQQPDHQRRHALAVGRRRLLRRRRRGHGRRHRLPHRDAGRRRAGRRQRAGRPRRRPRRGRRAAGLRGAARAPGTGRPTRRRPRSRCSRSSRPRWARPSARPATAASCSSASPSTR